MSSEGAAVDMMCCANCGISAIDEIKLKDCDGGCDLVKYCNDDCQENHREQHEEECKKRLIQIRDKQLFTQPDESYMGECPICFLPLSLDESKSAFMSCCCQTICKGCNIANQKREYEAGLEQRCAFCREPLPETKEEHHRRVMKRVKKNCPVALRYMGNKRYQEGDYKSAFEYWTKAGELGDASAHHNLSITYRKGQFVEKDAEKEIYHLEEAAIGGHPAARYNLGCIEWNNGRHERAKKHLIIAANLGYHDSLELIKKLYIQGHATKEDYADALRAYQVAVDATKSAEREKEEEAMKNGEIK
jgi:hypothetical protein